MPRLLWLMFQVPISSPQMTRMFGFPVVAVGVGVGLACCACAEPAADSASNDPPLKSKSLRPTFGVREALVWLSFGRFAITQSLSL
jgi:hypothetical protein